ncbi:hypothetical protein STEG23_022729, partial [Scotinomys teguina]
MRKEGMDGGKEEEWKKEEGRKEQKEGHKWGRGSKTFALPQSQANTGKPGSLITAENYL